MSAFDPQSRYAGLPTTTYVLPDGRNVVYLRRRWVPQPERFALIEEHVVAQGERLDHIAAAAIGAGEQFWRICDANAALRPDELEQPGVVLRICMPEGIAGPDDA